MPNLPTLPTTFTVPYSLPVGGTTWAVHSGDNLQTVLDAAALGDVIVIDAGATFTGNFKCPVKAGTDWLYIISSALASLPAEGIRVAPSDSANMPIISSNDTSRPVLAFFENAHHYRFVGIEFVNTQTAVSGNFNMITTGYGGTYSDSSYLWTSVTTDAKLPSHITFDRCYIHNLNVYPKFCRCGWIMNGHYMASVECYYKNFIDGSDAQAINIVQGTGPYKIVNNYLEATGENFMIGGSDPAITDANAEDVEFRGNYCYKDQANWTPHWTIKNLFELKNGRRVLCTGNLMENCYQDNQGQGATGIVLTVRDQSGGNTSAQLQDITISYNRIHSCGKAWRLTGYDGLHPSLQTQRVLIEHNAVNDLSTVYSSGASGESISSTATGGALDVTERHNLILAATASSNDVFLTAPTGSKAVENWTYENNIASFGNYGIFGNGGSVGAGAITTYTTGTTLFQKNVLINQSLNSRYAYNASHFAVDYAGLNSSLANEIASVGFTDPDGSDYVLDITSPYHNWGSDGTDPGPNWATLGPLISLARNGQEAPPASLTIDSTIVTIPDGIRTLSCTFTAVSLTGNVLIELSRDNGTTYVTIIAAQPYYEGSFSYVVGTAVGGFCKVRITSIDSPAVTATSSTFSLGERYKTKMGKQLLGAII